MHSVADCLQLAGFALDPLGTHLFPQVAHIRYPSRRFDAPRSNTNDKPGDIFIFPSGTVVAWDTDDFVVNTLIANTLKPAARNPHSERMETEDLEFYEDSSTWKSRMIDEKIVLGTKSMDSLITYDKDAAESERQDVRPYSHLKAETGTSSTSGVAEHNVTLAKIAFSSGLARSTKLAVLESSLEHYFATTSSIPTLLSRGTRLPYSRRFILRKTGELLSVRAQLNLSSELTDSLPDLFWDSRHELGLEGYFDQVGRVLDVGIRIKVLNEKMDYAQEIAAVLREELNGRHGLSLEWAIVGLILLEVGFEVLRVWRERTEVKTSHRIDSIIDRTERIVTKIEDQQGP